MRLWAIGWLALWGVVFGISDNLVIFAKEVKPVILEEVGNNDAGAGGDEANLSKAQAELNIAKKNLDFIKTPFAEGSV